VPVPESEYSRMMAMLERQNKALREQLAERDAHINALREDTLKMKREHSLDIKKSVQIRNRDLSIRSLKQSLGDLRRRLDATKRFRSLWDGAIEGEVYAAGLYPEKKKGFVLLRQKISRDELDGLSGAYVVYTDEQSNRDLLKEKCILYADTSLVGELDGCFFVRASDVDAVKQKARVSTLSLEKIVEGYRKKRD